MASTREFKQFKNGAQFGAWIGLVPTQHSSGGKNHLGVITKRGDTYLPAEADDDWPRKDNDQDGLERPGIGCRSGSARARG